MEKSKKITLATVKSFIRKAGDNLYIREDSTFDGMIDGTRFFNSEFEKAEKTDWAVNHSLGINGLYLVKQSRDYFTHFDNGEFIGIDYYNSCGSGVLAVKK